MRRSPGTTVSRARLRATRARGDSDGSAWSALSRFGKGFWSKMQTNLERWSSDPASNLGSVESESGSGDDPFQSSCRRCGTSPMIHAKKNGSLVWPSIAWPPSFKGPSLGLTSWSCLEAFDAGIFSLPAKPFLELAFFAKEFNDLDSISTKFGVIDDGGHDGTQKRYGNSSDVAKN